MIRTFATLSIWSETLWPDDVSTILDFAPDNKVIKGSERHPPVGTPGAHGWHVSCDKRGADVTADEVLEELAARVKPLLPKMPDLRARDAGLDVRFVVRFGPADYSVPLPKEQNLWIFIEKEVVAMIAAFGATFDFEVFRGYD
ncbi:MAG: DUF4279 domain-containing protein [Parafilimonas terrae]|nr:DUF4279 domain-containing protein [Parafilimonas terrae]